LSESIGASKAAKSLGISQQTMRKYLGFAAVPEKLRQFVPKELSRDDCIKLYRSVPNVPAALRVAQRIIPMEQKLRKQYLKSLSYSPKSSHLKLLKKAKSGLLQQRITIGMNKTNARKLRALSMKQNIDVTEMADEIISSYLKRK
jgi:ParB family chromosome partitioning protein